jgi:hypothetical protein
MLDVEIIGKDGNSVLDVALVDTGADVSAFPRHWRRRLGILHKECRRRSVVTASGTGFKLVYEPGVEAVILGRRLRLQATFLDTPVALLGREDFLNAFQVTFDQPAERFAIDAWQGQSETVDSSRSTSPG